MNGDSEQDLQRAEWWLDCAEREKGGKGGGLAHTADSGIASALPLRSGTDGRHGVASDAAQDRTKDGGRRTGAVGLCLKLRFEPRKFGIICIKKG